VHRSVPRLSLSSVLLTVSMGTQAAIYCVATPAQLDTAFGAARSGGNDEIRIEQGNYDVADFVDLLYAAETIQDLAISGGWLSGCLFHDPGAKSVLDGDDRGQGMRLGGTVGSTITVSRLAFVNLRSSTTPGAALRLNPYPAQDANLVLEQNVFIGNEATTTAGAVSGRTQAGSIVLRNNLFFGNRAARWSIDLEAPAGAILTLTNNTVVGNATLPGSAYGEAGVRIVGAATLRASNNLLWDNGTIDLQAAIVQLRRNDIGTRAVGTATVDDGNLSVEPGLAGGLVSFAPGAGSPLIDVGLANVPGGVGARDVVGETRVQGLAVDIGAYETRGPLFSDGFE